MPLISRAEIVKGPTRGKCLVGDEDASKRETCRVLLSADVEYLFTAMIGVRIVKMLFCLMLVLFQAALCVYDHQMRDA
jgi:hypothetical protein